MYMYIHIYIYICDVAGIIHVVYTYIIIEKCIYLYVIFISIVVLFQCV